MNMDRFREPEEYICRCCGQAYIFIPRENTTTHCTTCHNDAQADAEEFKHDQQRDQKNTYGVD